MTTKRNRVEEAETALHGARDELAGAKAEHLAASSRDIQGERGAQKEAEQAWVKVSRLEAEVSELAARVEAARTAQAAVDATEAADARVVNEAELLSLAAQAMGAAELADVAFDAAVRAYGDARTIMETIWATALPEVRKELLGDFTMNTKNLGVAARTRMALRLVQGGEAARSAGEGVRQVYTLDAIAQGLNVFDWSAPPPSLVDLVRAATRGLRGEDEFAPPAAILQEGASA